MVATTLMPLVVGNWKMHGLSASLAEIRLLAAMLEGVELACDVAICPPATLLRSVSEALEESVIAVGGQDCRPEPSGAYTGDVSAEMIRDAGATLVIVGHSERRGFHGETDELVREKAAAAHRAGLVSIICIGETEAQRDAGNTLDVIRSQLDGSVPATSTAGNTVLAYEPVWAIGSGRTPTEEQIGEVHDVIRSHLTSGLGRDADEIRLLYGGSMKPQNAASILKIPNVDGGLVGQASLSAKDFLGIIAVFAPL
ncbi:triosephosphate isomerase [Rhodoligotrophos appendicifer]|uniref:triose-phosphate isomerase n=1 Tax=Rhodoligotrophos appendicifer TaxID=987056 RepID=UPI001184F4FD|nr:triose-phosphate isomerase [Rhodoligotrophos appendicifer]